MTDFILRSEPSEHINNRQTAKIMYLQQEISQLQEYIQDLEHMLKLNKEALKLAFLPRQSENNNNKFENTSHLESVSLHHERNSASPKNNVTSSTAIANTGLEKNSLAQPMLENLFEENKRLMETIDRLTKERNIAQSKALINQQIAEETQNHEQDIVSDMEEKIGELRRIIQDKEYTIQELEKSKPLNENDMLIKFKEIITPNEQVIKQHNELESHIAHISQLTKEMSLLKENNQKYKEENMLLKSELFKMKMALINPVNIMRLRHYIIEGRDNFSEEGNINEEPQEGEEFMVEKNEEGESGAEPDPDLVVIGEKRIPPVLTLNKLKGESEKRYSGGANQAPIVNTQPYVPQKILREQEYLDKISDLEKSLEQANSVIRKEALNNKILLKDLFAQENFNQALLATNDRLVASNRMHQEKLEKLLHSLDFFKSFYYKYINLIRNRGQRSHSMVLSSSSILHTFPQSVCSKQTRKNEILENLNAKAGKKARSELQRISEKGNEHEKNSANEKETHISILEEDENEDDVEETGGEKVQGQAEKGRKEAAHKAVAGASSNQGNAGPKKAGNKELAEGNSKAQISQKVFEDLDEPEEELDIHQCKMFMLNLAKDLYMNSNLKNSGITKYVLKNVEIGGFKHGFKNFLRPRRSMSNPLDYISKDLKKNVSSIDRNGKKARFKLEEKKRAIIANNLKTSKMDMFEDFGYMRKSNTQFLPFHLEVSQIRGIQELSFIDKINEEDFILKEI